MAKITKTIDTILDDARRQGILNKRHLTSLAWFRNKILAMNKQFRPADFFEEKERFVERIELGRMYNFRYDPKTKEKLPYYDLFPLCIPFKPLPGGFLGLNLHYLNPKHRAIFLSKLADLEKIDDNGHLRIRFTYNLLTSSAKYSWFRPCIKRYRYSNIKSKFILIKESEWNVVTFLPTEIFMKEKKMHIWDESSLIAQGK